MGTRATCEPNDLTIVAGYEGILRANRLDSLDALFAASQGERLDKPRLSPWRERLRLTLNAGGERRTFYLKRFHSPPTSAQREVKRSRSGAWSLAGMEWSFMHRFAADGIHCAKPVAFGEQLQGTTELRSAILTEAVPGVSLERWAAQGDDHDRATARRLLIPLALLVARLHEHGYIHRDLYLSHIFFDPTAPRDRSLHLIDLARVIQPHGRRRRWLIKDLASLNFSAPRHLVSNTDRLRWLTHYLAASKLDLSARRLVYRIVGKTKRIADHDRRRRAKFEPRPSTLDSSRGQSPLGNAPRFARCQGSGSGSQLRSHNP